MIRKIHILVLAFTFLIFSSTIVKAQDNNQKSPNNVFGIHIHDDNDLENAARLVNSRGGDWGYVTMVIRKDDKNTQKWQEAFDKMRRLHLIPLLRIASRQQNGGWEKPSFDEIDSWVDFLNDLNWVIKNRYVIIGNEPNHAKEWGNEVNPEEYARYLHEFSKKLEESDSDYFVLPAGLDASAPTDASHMDEVLFLRRMFIENNKVFEFIEGWNSHSYPNPNFSSSPTKIGRGSIKTYDWELSLLKSYGLEKELPVFITETGWIHNKYGRNGNLSPSSVSDRFLIAFNDVWLTDERIHAVTPFILNYTEEPFDKFSWTDEEGKFYKFYFDVQNIEKVNATPEQNHSLDILALLFPKIIKRDNLSFGIALVRNTGQSIWEKGKFQTIDDGFRSHKITTIQPGTIEPNHSGLIYLSENILTSEK